MQRTRVAFMFSCRREDPATEEQVESKEAKIKDFEKKHYLAQHIILSTTSTRLSLKIKNMKSAHEMWEAVKADVTTRSTLYLIDAENQLERMRLNDSSDPKTHLAELKAHFQLIIQRHDNLIKMGSTFSDAHLATIIMTSLPPSYRPALQTITAAQKASAIASTSSSSMVKLKPADLIEFFTEEAQHHIIEEDRTKQGESALYVHSGQNKGRRSKNDKGRGRQGHPTAPSKLCDNCGKPGHTKEECWGEGGGKEGQGPCQKKKPAKREEKGMESAAIAEDEELFAFACTSDFSAITDALKVPKFRLGAIVDSGASRHFCPDRTKFVNFKSIEDRPIKTADGRVLKAIGMGDVHIELPNGSGRTKAILKEAVYVPEMAFTLVSVSRLDDAKCATLFKNGMCTIMDPAGRTMATLPRHDGLYRLVASTSNTPDSGMDYASVASVKMTISEAHQKLGHLAHTAIKYAMKSGQILGVELDPESKPEFCETCAKEKSAKQPFPKESQTRAEEYGERVHWDL